MKGVCALIFLGLFTIWADAQFLNNRPFPTYSLENMPETAFSCRDKILGGYYADVDAQCQMFHVCVKVAGVGVQDFRFLCPNGTAFDQDHQICADWEDVDCDATTLYYSSDNFDLYRIGSGFEAKLKKYGEDEETFALQRAETGDVRINKEHQAQRINQQKQTAFYKKQRNNQDNERDIFKGSSSSNFFNNKNGGKENDDDYDDNTNINQDNDQTQKRKLNRKPTRRPVQNNNNNRQYETTQAPQQTTVQQKRINKQPANFVNNFAGSSYVPTTTAKPTTSLSNERYTVAVNNHRLRNSHRHRGQNNNNYRHSQTTSEPLTVSTPAPFRQNKQQQNNQLPNNYNNKQTNQQNYQTTTPALKQITQNYDVKKTNFVTKKAPAPFSNAKDDYPTTFSPKFQKQYYQTTTKKFENYPTTYSPKTNPAYNTISQVTTQYNTNNQFSQNNQPKPFNNNQYTQKPQQYNNQYTQNTKPQFNNPQSFNNQKPVVSNSPSPFTNSFNTNTPNNYNQFNNNKVNTNQQQSTPKTTAFTQYTPTIPKVSQTTPSSRSNRYDETQYDDGSYNPKYDYDGSQDEFLKTAHSQNIAKSRNDLALSQKNQEQKQQTKPSKFYDTPRPFSVSSNTPKQHQQQQEYTKPVQTVTPKNINQQTVNKQQQKQPIPSSTTTLPTKKPVKDVSYDYAYYDTNVGSEPEYEIETEIKKSTVKN